MRLTTKFTFRTDLKSDTCDLCSQCTKSDNHSIYSVLQVQNFTAGIDVDLLGQIAEGDGFRDRRDTAHLICQVGGQFVDDAGQFAPCSFDVQDKGLTAQFSGNEACEN